MSQTSLICIFCILLHHFLANKITSDKYPPTKTYRKLKAHAASSHRYVCLWKSYPIYHSMGLWELPLQGTTWRPSIKFQSCTFLSVSHQQVLFDWSTEKVCPPNSVWIQKWAELRYPFVSSLRSHPAVWQSKTYCNTTYEWSLHLLTGCQRFSSCVFPESSPFLCFLACLYLSTYAFTRLPTLTGLISPLLLWHT